ncbi:putative RRP45-exosome complex exonuclease [Violaceomyces palustris]|uniref:RRP45-exosome complex exonuclease n=1 Tax=Violaceomyces palustris TaxID=1673888 RepID=A0ACD0NM58_9BASI|nr:putative RRP45-exosome complex exonuclease [Violaceomyces palustris]
MAPGQLPEPSLTEVEFLNQSLSRGLRLDGRGFYKCRDIKVRFGDELGCVNVWIGSTRVSTSVRATLVPPRADRPYEGFLQITTDISPMAGSEYDMGGGASSSARAREVLFDRLVEKAVRRTEAVDREALCVVAGEQVWNIHLTVHLLADTGAALDAAVLSSMISLRHFRRPDYTIENGNEVRLYSVEERVPVPLAIHHTPLCVTFSLFNLDRPSKPLSGSGQEQEESSGLDYGNTVSLMDPSLTEEILADSKLVLVLNSQKEICVLDKAGGAPLDAEVLLETLRAGLARVKELSELVDEHLRKDASVRVVEVR